MRTPIISIIIPTYNVECYIARCLESCINQTLQEIEIIIVDDCGADDSIPIAQRYAKQDTRVRIIHNPQNLGTFAARIRGVESALGLYICFLDADDYLEPNACQKAYQAAMPAGEKDPESLPDIVFFGMRFEPPTWKRVAPPVIAKPLAREEVLAKVFAHCATPPWHICAKLYKASHIARAAKILVAHMGENVRLTMAEDVLKSFLLCALAKSSVGIKDKLYVYCESQSSITRKIDPITQSKKIADISCVISALESLEEIDEIRKNPAFYPARSHAIAILQSVRELEYRYGNIPDPAPLSALKAGWGGGSTQFHADLHSPIAAAFSQNALRRAIARAVWSISWLLSCLTALSSQVANLCTHSRIYPKPYTPKALKSPFSPLPFLEILSVAFAFGLAHEAKPKRDARCEH